MIPRRNTASWILFFSSRREIFSFSQFHSRGYRNCRVRQTLTIGEPHAKGDVHPGGVFKDPLYVFHVQLRVRGLDRLWANPETLFLKICC